MIGNITSYVVGFAVSSFSTLNSIHKDQIIACDNGAYALIATMQTYDTDSE